MPDAAKTDAAKTRKRRGAVLPVAGREQILSAARAIGTRQGWKAVTIRAVAQQLGYRSPLLYQHFRDKQDLLTVIAINGQQALAAELVRNLPADPRAAILAMVARYWCFLLEHKQLYRLMNGMDGVAIDCRKVARAAQRGFAAPAAIVADWMRAARGTASGSAHLLDELWALLHGMAVLHLDRDHPFTATRARASVARLLAGATAPHHGLH